MYKSTFTIPYHTITSSRCAGNRQSSRPIAPRCRRRWTGDGPAVRGLPGDRVRPGVVPGGRDRRRADSAARSRRRRVSGAAPTGRSVRVDVVLRQSRRLRGVALHDTVRTRRPAAAAHSVHAAK